MSFNHKNIVGAATTVVDTVGGVLGSVVINIADESGTIIIYDGIDNTGVVIASITLPATLLASQFVLPYNVAYAAGLTIVTTGSTLDITICSSH